MNARACAVGVAAVEGVLRRDRLAHPGIQVHYAMERGEVGWSLREVAHAQQAQEDAL